MGEVILSIAALCYLGGNEPKTVAAVSSAQRACQREYAVCMQKKPTKKSDDEWLLSCIVDIEGKNSGQKN